MGIALTTATTANISPPDPVESEVVKFIVKTYLNETAGFKEIARQLSARGIKTRKGNASWAFTTVKLILSNRCLVGEVRFGKRKMKLNKATGRRVPVRLDPVYPSVLHRRCLADHQ